MFTFNEFFGTKQTFFYRIMDGTVIAHDTLFLIGSALGTRNKIGEKMRMTDNIRRLQNVQVCAPDIFVRAANLSLITLSRSTRISRAYIIILNFGLTFSIPCAIIIRLYLCKLDSH